MPRRLKVGQGVGEGPYEDQGHALCTRGDELTRSHSDHHSARAQAANQLAFAGDPLGEHFSGEGLTQSASLVEGQSQLALLITEVGEEKVEFETGRPNMLGVAR